MLSKLCAANINFNKTSLNHEAARKVLTVSNSIQIATRKVPFAGSTHSAMDNEYYRVIVTLAFTTFRYIGGAFLMYMSGRWALLMWILVEIILSDIVFGRTCSTECNSLALDNPSPVQYYGLNRFFLGHRMAGQSPLFRDVVLGAAASATPSQKIAIPSTIQEQAVDTDESPGDIFSFTSWSDPFKVLSQHSDRTPLIVIPEPDWTFKIENLVMEAANWSPSHSANSSTATTESSLGIWEGFYTNSDTFGNWNPWQSKDFLSEAIVEKQNAFNLNLSSQTLNGSLGWLSTYRQPNSIRTSTLQLRITPKHTVNVCNHTIQFEVVVKNIPDQFSVSCGMLAARALGPTGEQFHCTIRKDGDANTFVGCFFAGKETGFYVVQAQMLVPKWFQGNVQNLKDGAIKDSTNVIVSKNYLRDSVHSYSLKCIYDLLSNPVGQKKQHSKLWGLTCDTQTNYIYYSDRDAHLIHCMDPEGRHISSFGLATRTGMLNARRPTGLAFDHVHRRLVVADKDNHRISFFTPEGQFVNSLGNFGNQNGEFNYPWDVAVSPLNGNIAVTDSKNKRVQLFGQFGDFRGKYSTLENNSSNVKPELDHPRGCSFDALGRHLYVTDYNFKNVLEFTSDISFCRKLLSNSESKLRRPQGVVVDDYDNVLVADSSNNCVRIIAHEGSLVSSINAMADNNLVFPVNLTTLAGGQLMVLDGERKLHLV
ncbi:unnamed protein product [Orchesella dallaii]|uniref:SMP-30/Gluconolactonase/LRE-like region domain-containing protein n=1 Tax=Orchesella dallaii TaxID=48710 RepID=A0ABP1PMQ4_9HEXA